MNTVLPWSSAWITGAGRGIGAHLSRLLCRGGVTVFGSARNREELSALQQELQVYPGTFIPVPLDITDSQAVEEIFREWDMQSILPDLVVLNAGTHDPFPASEFTAARCKNLFNINLQGTLNCLEPVLKRFMQADSSVGASVNRQIAVVSSVAGYRGLPTAAAYGASKAALINLCEALYLDLKDTNIKLQLINPGFVRTPLTDKNEFKMPALMEPEDAADRIVEGLQTERFEIIFPRRFVYLLKLFRILPYSWYFALTSKIKT